MIQCGCEAAHSARAHIHKLSQTHTHTTNWLRNERASERASNSTEPWKFTQLIHAHYWAFSAYLHVIHILTLVPCCYFSVALFRILFIYLLLLVSHIYFYDDSYRTLLKRIKEKNLYGMKHHKKR